jgi:septin 3/9/12
MADTPRDATLKQTPAPRSEKAPVDFGYVGIDSILEQMRRKAMKQGFEFNIMVVGESPRQPATPDPFRELASAL